MIQEFLHKFDLYGTLAGLFGALIALGLMPPGLTLRQGATVLAAGMAVAVFLVPLALHLIGLPPGGPPADAIKFLAGLLGMRVIVVFKAWGDRIENPRDLLDPLKRQD